jgi:SAM-dependent methyltransferase
MDYEATELNSVDKAMEMVAIYRDHVPVILARIRPFMRLEPGADVLDVGAAQGATVTAFLEHGFSARGVEPSPQALETRKALVARTGVETDIVKGVAERLPFGDAEFDFVNCNSVMEHVDDPWTVFAEVFRVLRPGGGFLFSTTSAISPFHREIARFPAFPWYPDRVRRAIMAWAVREKPWLVGYTDRPAYLWFKHREVRAELAKAGFRRVVDQWELRDASGLEHGLRGRVIRTAARSRPAHLLGDIGVGGMQYLAVK